MAYMPETPPDRSALVYRYHEQLYRLALLVAGEPDQAEMLVERAYHELPPGGEGVETHLIRALLPRRAMRRPWRKRAEHADLMRATLDQSRADALFKLLAAMPPAARLVVGLHYIRGTPAADIAVLLDNATTRPPDEILARFRVDAVRTLELVPAGSDEATLLALDRAMDGLLDPEASLALRRATLEDARQRALRDGLNQARDLLPRAIPALFGATPPLALTEDLLEIVQGRQPQERNSRVTWARGLLALGVLALAAAIVLVPSLLARRATPAATAPLTAAELIDRAIHRFDRAPLQEGVLHEQYRVQLDNQPAYLIERWYDYAEPHRLLLSVTTEESNSPPLLTLSSDGRSLIQYRYGERQFIQEARSVDARVSEDEARSAMPSLRSEPTAWFFSRGVIDQVDITPLYLGQARAAQASLLGQTNFLGRAAHLLTYRADQVPSWEQRPGAFGARPVRIVLTIDAQTYALLDITILAEGETESEARHPLRAQQFDLLANVPDSQFQLPGTRDLIERDNLMSAHWPELPGNESVSLDKALSVTPSVILAPQQLPDRSMRGRAVAIGGSNVVGVALFYEGEFQNLMVLPYRLVGSSSEFSDEREAGAFRYRLLPGGGSSFPGLMAQVYAPDTPEQQVLVALLDEYATGAERETTLQQVIASLTPLTEQTLPALRRSFAALETAGGTP